MTDRLDPATQTHRRLNPLTGEWVIVSPQRTQRPWQGRTDVASSLDEMPYDPHCPLCPGNERAGGAVNADYSSTYVFENDFAALRPDSSTPTDDGLVGSDELFVAAGARGECRVVCFSPRHDLTLAKMAPGEVGVVVDLWRDQARELGETWEWVQLFETRGEICGASNPHPHGQIWSSSFVPNEVGTELAAQQAYWSTHRTPLLLDYAEREIAACDRVVVTNERWVVVVPYWAYWPYETIVLPRRPLSSFVEVDDADAHGLADVLHRMLGAFDRLFDVPFPYCSGWHGTPRSGGRGGQLHAHYYPPLLRSADVAKIPASYELLANLQRDLTPEAAAAHLRTVL